MQRRFAAIARAAAIAALVVPALAPLATARADGTEAVSEAVTEAVTEAVSDVVSDVVADPGSLLDPSVPAATTVTPGDSAVTSAGQCTTNFAFSAGTATFIGIAAHCFSTSGSTVTNGCSAVSLPLGSAARIGNATGTLAYSSWLTMQRMVSQGQLSTNSYACAYNDFALVRLPAGVTLTATVPYWGGPVGVGGATGIGQRVYGFGNSGYRLGIGVLKPKSGISTGNLVTSSAWRHTVYMASPGIPGDSGSALLDSAGRAVGVLSTISALGWNTYTDVGQAMAWARATEPATFGSLALLTGGPFDPGLVGSPVGGI